MKRSQIVTLAREYMHVPYRHQGRTREGLDCVGLLLVVMWELGTVPRDWDYRNYPRVVRPRIMLELLNQWLQPVAQAQEGDVLVMPASKDVWHVGFRTRLPYLGVAGVIHAWSPNGEVVEHAISGMWRHPRASFQLPGVE